MVQRDNTGVRTVHHAMYLEPGQLLHSTLNMWQVVCANNQRIEALQGKRSGQLSAAVALDPDHIRALGKGNYQTVQSVSNNQ